MCKKGNDDDKKQGTKRRKKTQLEMKKKIIETRSKELNWKIENKNGKGEVPVIT